MVIKSITYKDLDDNEITEDFYFRLSKSEVAEWLTAYGDKSLDNILKTLTQTKNMTEAMELAKDIIRRTYGVRSANGKTFEKSEAKWLEFYQSDAYSELLMEFLQDIDKFTEFLDAVLPADLKEEVEKIRNNNQSALPDLQVVK